MNNYPSSYPPDFRRALENKLEETKLDELLELSTPIFLFGPLMLPSVLKAVTETSPDVDMSSRMIQGSLLRHKLGIFKDTNIPFVLERDSMDECVSGMVVFGLTAEQKGWIHHFEADNVVRLEQVEVEVVTEDCGLRTIEAGAFVWKEKTPCTGIEAGSKWWNVKRFLQGQWYSVLKRGYDSG